MNAGERGFLLLTGSMGDPARKPMTVAQFRNLATRVQQMEKPDSTRHLKADDLVALGYDKSMAQHIIDLLSAEDALDRYLRRGLQQHCIPITRVSSGYPQAVRQRLGLDAPGCLWAKGDITLLNTQTVSLVGSRDLAAPNRKFAEAVGTETARQGFTLVSGNARGADRTAQEACLAAGGRVICVVADELQSQPLRENVLYLSEDSFDLPFTGQRALSRNRVIHTLGYITLVAGCTLGRGGTWDGTTNNLRRNLSPVFCFADGSEAMMELERLGATLITQQQLRDLTALQPNVIKFI